MLEIGNELFLAVDQPQRKIDQTRHTKCADNQLIFGGGSCFIRALMCENGTVQTVEDKENEAEEPELTVAGEETFAALFADKKNGYNNDGNKEPAERFESTTVSI